ILLLEIGKEQLLIGVTASKISLLHELKEPIEVEQSSPMNNAFAQKLQEAIANRKKPSND
ncbi:MAG: flagellar biosynthetic protein FliO, partial [Hydrogenovibrio sp.]|nr:flagellar biosynthetic protein FliO [Hydrogenovibrio sp.]